MPGKRSRCFQVSQQEILQMLDADESEEEALLGVGHEDMMLFDAIEKNGGPVEVVIYAPDAPVSEVETREIKETLGRRGGRRDVLL